MPSNAGLSACPLRFIRTNCFPCSATIVPSSACEGEE
jgi:hypothetical protein